MIAADLRYLEGDSAFAERMEILSGRVPNSAQKQFGSSCMLHGRLFWDSAADAPLETKPLLLYYGAAAFAKALVLATNGCTPGDLAQAHGLSCYAGDGDLIANFGMTAQGNGLFQEFNDVAAAQSRLHYIEGSTPRQRIYPTAPSGRLSTLRIRLIDCFSRIPSLKKAYELSTGETPRLINLFLHQATHRGVGIYRIRVDVPGRFESTEELGAMVAALRACAPFLAAWRVLQAENAWGNVIIQFENFPTQADDLDAAVVQGGAAPRPPADMFDALDSLPPLCQREGGMPCFVQPHDGEYIAEVSLMLAALLGLSSLVRYHPHTWTACVHRRRIADRAVDDRLLPVIETFLEVVQRRFPEFVASELMRDP